MLYSGVAVTWSGLTCLYRARDSLQKCQTTFAGILSSRLRFEKIWQMCSLKQIRRKKGLADLQMAKTHFCRRDPWLYCTFCWQVLPRQQVDVVSNISCRTQDRFYQAQS